MQIAHQAKYASTPLSVGRLSTATLPLLCYCSIPEISLNSIQAMNAVTTQKPMTTPFSILSFETLSVSISSCRRLNISAIQTIPQMIRTIFPRNRPLYIICYKKEKKDGLMSQRTKCRSGSKKFAVPVWPVAMPLERSSVFNRSLELG